MKQKTKAEIKQQFHGLEYPVQIVGRHVAVTESMKDYALEKLSKIDHLGGHVLDATIVMDIQKLNHSVDFQINLNGSLIRVTSLSQDMYASIDAAIHRLKIKLRRYLDRLHDHHKQTRQEWAMEEEIVHSAFLDEYNDAIEESRLQDIEISLRPGVVVSHRKPAIKLLRQDEAVMKMDLSEQSFLVYRDEVSHRLRIIYRKDDQKHYGIFDLPQ